MGDPRIDRIAARQAAQTAATRLTVTPLMADTAKMSDEQAAKLTALFDVFDPDGHAYSVGDVASYDGVLYRVVQAHRSQADWTPDKVQPLDAGSGRRRALPRTRSSSRQVPLTRVQRR